LTPRSVSLTMTMDVDRTGGRWGTSCPVDPRHGPIGRGRLGGRRRSVVIAVEPRGGRGGGGRYRHPPHDRRRGRRGGCSRRTGRGLRRTIALDLDGGDGGLAHRLERQHQQRHTDDPDASHERVTPETSEPNGGGDHAGGEQCDGNEQIEVVKERCQDDSRLPTTVVEIGDPDRDHAPRPRPEPPRPAPR
jgi:hypothetical protein